MKLFFAYDQADYVFAQVLERNLKPARDIYIWHRDKIAAGSRIGIEIERNLRDADVVVYFLSADFLASDFYYEIEEEVVRLAEKGALRLMPIVVRPCLWEYSRFNEKLGVKVYEVTSYKNDDEAAAAFSRMLLELKPAPKNSSADEKPSATSSVQNRQELVAYLRELIAKNKIEQALNEMDKVSTSTGDKELLNTVLLLKSRYNAAKRDERMGLVTSENANSERNKLVMNLLNLIDEIPEEVGLGDLEASNAYLDQVKQTAEFESKAKYQSLFVLIRDKQQEIDNILREVENVIQAQGMGAHANTLQQIWKRYQALREAEITEGTEGDLNKIRQELIDLVDEAEITEGIEGDLNKIRQELIDLVDLVKKEEIKQVSEATVEDLTVSDTESLNEAKLIILGDGEVGKTTLLKNLIDSSYKLGKHPSTHGLDITRLNLPIPTIGSFRLNIWDYGGQGRYRGLQQFFSTPKALYLYVTVPEGVGTSEDEYSGSEYWLDFVKMHGFDEEDNRDSSILFVMNKCDIGGNQLVDEAQLLDKYGVKDFIRVSCETGQGLEQIKATIIQRLGDTGMINRTFPKSWVLVKSALEEKGKVYPIIDYSEYLTLFEQHVPFTATDIVNQNEELSRLKHRYDEGNLADYLDAFFEKMHFSSVIQMWNDGTKDTPVLESIARQIILEGKAQLLVKYMHTAGMLLYFPNVASLSNKLILQPDWIRAFAYELLSNPYCQSGMLDRKDLPKIFPGDGKNRDYVIDLLLHFNLAYKRYIDGEEMYILPILFPDEPPAGLIDFSILKDVVAYECSFSPILPADFLSRLMAHLHTAISHQNTPWKRGVLFQSAIPRPVYAYAVEHWKEKKISVSLIGDENGDLLVTIANAIHDIVARLVGRKGRFASLSIDEILRKSKDAIGIRLHEHRKAENAFQLDIAAIRKYLSIPNQGAQPTATSVSVSTEIFSQGQTKDTKTILFIGACPPKKPEIGITKEYASVDKARQAFGQNIQFDPNPELDAKGEELANILLDNRSNIIHFSMHGSRSGVLYFTTNIIGKDDYQMDAQELKDIFEEVGIRRPPIELICFSACHSLGYARALASVAPYTVGMDGFFPVEAARLFAEIFYSHWFNGRSGMFCFKQAVRAIQKAGFSDQENKAVAAMPQLFIENELQTFEI